MICRIPIVILVIAAARLACPDSIFAAPAEPPASPLRVIAGHEDGVLSVVYSPDGTQFASGSADRTARIWDAATGKELFRLKGHSDSVTHVMYSGDGKRLVTGSVDGTARVWDTKTGDLLAVLKGHTAHVHCIGVSADGKRVATGSCDQTARIWDVEKERAIHVIRHPHPVTSLALSPDGKLLLTETGFDQPTDPDAKNPPGTDCAVLMIDADTGKLIRKIGSKYVTVHLGFSSDGKWMAFVGGTDTHNQWDLLIVDTKEVKAIRQLRFTGQAATLSLSADLKKILFSIGPNVTLCDVWTGKCPLTYLAALPYVNSVALSPDGRFALSGSGGMGDPYGSFAPWQRGGENVIKRRDLSVLAERHPVVFHVDAPADANVRTFWPTQLAVSPDGGLVAASTFDGKCRLLDAASGKLVRDASGAKPSVNAGLAVAFSSSGKLLATGGAEVIISQTVTGKAVSQMNSEKGLTVNALLFSPDEKTLYAGCGEMTPGKSNSRTIAIDVASGKILASFAGHQMPVRFLAISPDGKRLVSGSAGDRQILSRGQRAVAELKAWELPDGRLLRTIANPGVQLAGAEFTASHTLAAAIDDQIYLWDVDTGSKTMQLAEHRANIVSITLSADRNRLASVDFSGRAVVWNMSTGKPIRTTDFHVNRFPGPMVVNDQILLMPDGAPALLQCTDVHHFGPDFLQLTPGE